MLKRWSHRLLRLPKQLYADTRGNALIIGAIGLPMLIGSAALGVDTFSMSLAKRQLQRSADSSALAGAYALVQDNAVRTSVDHDLGLNNKRIITKVVVETPPTSGTQAGNVRAVRVELTTPQPTPFFAFFVKQNPNVIARATAAVVFAGNFCMIALEEGNATGITFSGNSSLDIGCGVGTNSKAVIGISGGGAAFVRATPMAAVGGVPASSSYASGTKLLPYSPKQVDPYAKLPQPQVPANCQPKLVISPHNTTPIPVSSNGVYCYAGMDIKGPVTLPAGTYYVNGNSFSANSTAQITGTGVTIILTSQNATSDPASIATIDIHGNSYLNMSAPKGGTYGGVLFYQDPRARVGNIVKINGNSTSRYEGGFYMPKAYMTFNGNAGLTTECLQLIGRRLEFTGNSRVINRCPTDGAARAFDAIFVRLVG